MKIFPILALSLVAGAKAAAPSFIPRYHTSSHILKLRGGAGPLDPEIVAKGSTIACLAQGAMATLGPKLSNSQYGLSDELNDDIQQYHMKQLGTGILSLGIIGYYLFVKDAGIQKGIKVANVLWAYEMARNILTGEANSGGYSGTTMLKACVAIFAFVAYACTQDFADTAIKATSVLWGLTGLHCYFAPESAKKLWSMSETSERSTDNCREFAVFLLSYSILGGSLVFCDDMTNFKAWALASLPWFLNTAKNLLTGVFDKYSINQNMMTFWLIYHITIIVTLLL